MTSLTDMPADIVEAAQNVSRGIYLNLDEDGRPYMTQDDIEEVAKAILAERQNKMKLPSDIIESLLAIGPVEWGQTFCQSDDKHIDDLRDTMRITRDHFGIEAEETTISYVALEGTGTVLANTGMSPNSAQHARILVGAWNQLLALAKDLPSPPKGGA